ncbi:hypothetical protein OBBRIDRAFT_738356 [Obba rivulosa]|uniref:NADAR domain-containing protein n=1 Tax=Obba rivulosa TaxID=1052685 RepID=A0A8E2AQ08_9APHY|nr:hypothetical protein OBBRIDRAFT_738356 [Obba rivulosa]
MPRVKDDYVFFMKTNGRTGWAAQWYRRAPFTVPVTLPAPFGERTFTFPTTEHWMMAQKALLFGDMDVFWCVVGSPPAPKAAKALGRAVRDFDEAVWVRERERIVREGNLHKFRQNERERTALLATGEKIIVEASPRDRIWGIGFKEENAMRNKEQWGLNLLGKALMEVRGILGAEDGEE